MIFTTPNPRRCSRGSRDGRISARGGQATVEYLLLFAAITLVTLLSMTRIDEDVSTAFQKVFTTFAESVTGDGVATPGNDNPGGHGNSGTGERKGESGDNNSGDWW